MRLIDADKLIEYIDAGRLRSPNELCFSELDVVNMLLHAPTAYDVEAVVERLEEEKEKVGFIKATTEASAYLGGINDAIKIVKGGGLDV